MIGEFRVSKGLPGYFGARGLIQQLIVGCLGCGPMRPGALAEPNACYDAHAFHGCGGRVSIMVSWIRLFMVSR